MLTDIQPPPIEPVSLDEAKLFLRVDHDDENDLIETLIRSSRERLEDRLNIAMIERPMRLVTSEGGDIALPRWPVSSIETVTIDGEEPSVFTVNLRSRPVIVTAALGSPVSIEFTAGYGSQAGDVPAPLRQAILLLVAHGYEHRDGQERQLAPVLAAVQPGDERLDRKLVRLVWPGADVEGPG